MNYKFTTMLLLSVFIFFNCAIQKNTSNTRRPFWGDNPDTVVYLEQIRIGKEPLKRYKKDNGKYKIIVYDDKFLNTRCKLSYHFENDKLSFIKYSASDPDWDEEGLNKKVRQNFNNLYGNSSEIKIGNKVYYHWLASDAYIYYYFKRIPQDRISWRTFIANIIYSHESVQKSPYLKDFLLDSKY
jgi:hypothetical protein